MKQVTCRISSDLLNLLIPGMMQNADRHGMRRGNLSGITRRPLTTGLSGSAHSTACTEWWIRSVPVTGSRKSTRAMTQRIYGSQSNLFWEEIKPPARQWKVIERGWSGSLLCKKGRWHSCLNKRRYTGNLLEGWHKLSSSCFWPRYSRRTNTDRTKCSYQAVQPRLLSYMAPKGLCRLTCTVFSNHL